MSHFSDSKHSTYEEADKHQLCKDDMVKEYESIMKNDVWEVVHEHEEKSIVTSRQIYNIKHFVDGSIEKYKSILVSLGLSQT